MKARFSRASEIDLVVIGDFIARESPRRAVSFVRELRTAASKASTEPRLYPVHSELTRSVRRIVHGNYSIYYTVGPGEVVIERIIHSAMSGHPETSQA